MILVAAYWLALFPLFMIWGAATETILRTRAGHPLLLVLLGIIPPTVFFTITAFFIPLNITALVLFMILTAVVGFALRKSVLSGLRELKSETYFVAAHYKWFVFLTALMILCTSAQLPALTDNDTYYVQTIRWLNHYGLVNGLANLHLFLGQQSPWHILQAGLNFSFLTKNMNDLNGFLLVVFIWYAVFEIAREAQSGWLRYMLFFVPLLMWFTNSPSPDLPVIIFYSITFYNLSTKPFDKYSYRLCWLLLLFAVFIKITVAPLALTLLLYPKVFRSNLKFTLAVTLLLVSVLIVKNIIATGHPLYPFVADSLQSEWAVPKEILKGIHQTSNTHVYGTRATGKAHQLYAWLTCSGVTGVIHIAVTAIVLALPLFRIVRTALKKLYLASLLQFCILLLLSPQPRFMLPALLPFTALLAALCLKPLKLEPRAQILLAAALLATFPVWLRHISFTGMAVPAPATQFPNMAYSPQAEGSLHYNSPVGSHLLFTTGDGPLPCVSKKQLAYIRNKYGYVPRPAGPTLADGFVSEKVK